MAQIRNVHFVSDTARDFRAKQIMGTIIVPVQQGKKLTGIAGKLDRATEGHLSRAMEVHEFDGKKGKTLAIPTAAGVDASRVVLYGIGESVPQAVGDIERLGGEMAASVIGYNQAAVSILAGAQFSETAARHLALGVNLRCYEWNKVTSQEAEKARDAEISLRVMLDAPQRQVVSMTTQYRENEAVTVSAVHLARTLVNRRANDLNTAQLEEAAFSVAGDLGLEVYSLSVSELEENGMGAILAVGQASPNKPRVVVLKYRGNPSSDEKIALIGKGLVYDTGGLSIKSTDGMIEMNCDMGGAATVLGAISIAARQKLRTNIVAVLGIAENSLGSNSYRPGDILTTMSGKTVEVGNTDAEGRLVLADCMTYAQKVLGATTIIEASTLTGAAQTALGHSYAGLMTKDEKLAKIILQASANTGDPIWRLPMNDDFDAMLKSPTGHADMNNIGTPAGKAGASIGAHFLQRFVEKHTRFAHLDIAPVAWLKAPWGVTTSGGTGIGVRVMADSVRLLSRGSR